MVLSMLGALLANFLWTSKSIVDRLGKGGAWGALIAFNAFPSAFIIVTPYPESWTVALMLAGFIAVLNDRWILAGLAIGASTALRPTSAGFAIALGCAALYAAWIRRKDGAPKWWKPLIAIPLAGWGQLLEVILFKIFTGSATAYLRGHHAFTGPSQALRWSQAWSPLFYVQGFTAQHLDSVTMLGSFALMALAAREVVRSFKREQSIFLIVTTLTMLLLPLAAIIGYWGLNRYFLLSPLTFLCAGVVARKHFGFYLLWIALSLAVYWHVELCSFIAHGDPNVCPCLGRVQVVEPWAS